MKYQKGFKPILFATPQVQAIQKGIKHQTRRPIDKDISNWFNIDVDGSVISYVEQSTGDSYNPLDLARYQVGQILYVRETCYFETFEVFPVGEGNWVYRADDKNYPATTGWTPSIHMPKEAARIFLKVTDVRVERVQDITEEDAIKEGFSKETDHFTDGSFLTIPAKELFEEVWQKIYGNWFDNPYVFRYEFEVDDG